MGLDSGVQQVLKTGVGTVGFLSFATALWVRGGIYFAEARVFVRGSKPEIKGMVETLLVEAVEADAAIDALERLIRAKFGLIHWLQWRDPAAESGPEWRTD